MLKDILFASWFFLPAGLANMVPVFASNIPKLKDLNAPLDGGRLFRGQPIFGPHKTWRGLVIGIVTATITLACQQWGDSHSLWLRQLSTQVNYAHLPTLSLGAMFAIGALGGDAIESFFKRQHGILPGHGWFPFDQTDYIIGGCLTSLLFVRLPVSEYVWILVVWLLIHVIASLVGYTMGVKDRPI